SVASGGRGGRVTLDVRVDDRGDVSDAVLVETDADSLTVDAAIASAKRLRFHPALLGGRPIAVWTRQTFDVAGGGRGRRRPRRAGLTRVPAGRLQSAEHGSVAAARFGASLCLRTPHERAGPESAPARNEEEISLD